MGDSAGNHNLSDEGDSDNQPLSNVAALPLKGDGEDVRLKDMEASSVQQEKSQECDSDLDNFFTQSDHQCIESHNLSSEEDEMGACGGEGLGDMNHSNESERVYSPLSLKASGSQTRKGKDVMETTSNVSVLENSSGLDLCSAQGTDGSSFAEFENKHSNEATFLGEDLVDYYHAPYEGGLRLDELDDDVLFLIASYLDARVVRFALIQVCSRFQALFDNENYWRMRVTVRCPKKYPAVDCPTEFTWADACVEREDCYRVFQNVDFHTRQLMYSFDFSGEVDAVHLMNHGELLVSGDRGRCLNLIDLTKYPESEMRDMIVSCEDQLHGGWIWSITSVGDTLMTGCWDTKVRLFDISADLKLKQNYKTTSAVLSLFAEENEIVASCFDKTVCFIDCRSQNQRNYIFHKKSVLSVVGDDNFIITGSEDKTISIFDRRADKVLKSIELEHYPLCMSYKDNRLWFGDRQGMLHLYDGNRGEFSFVGSYDIGQKRKVSGIVDTWGALFACVGKKTIEVLEPTQDPGIIGSIYVPEKEIARIAYDHGVLVSAVSDGMRVWLPKYWGIDNYLL